jgi:hypothetical protein
MKQYTNCIHNVFYIFMTINPHENDVKTKLYKNKNEWYRVSASLLFFFLKEGRRIFGKVMGVFSSDNCTISRSYLGSKCVFRCYFFYSVFIR